MNRNFTSLIRAIVVLFSVMMPSGVKATSALLDTAYYYYLKVDTANTYLGYFRVNSSAIDRVEIADNKDDYALWKFKVTQSWTPDYKYYMINKATRDTLVFTAPMTSNDTIAVIAKNDSTKLNEWEDIEQYMSNIFTAGVPFGQPNAGMYKLTYDKNAVIMVSKGDETTLPVLNFVLEHEKFYPASNEEYWMRVDTLNGISTDGFLFCDIDSMLIDTLRGDTSKWHFEQAFVKDDTAYFKIYNNAYNTMMAFNVPDSFATAKINANAPLFLWALPCYSDADSMIMKVRDTTTNIDYFLGMKESSLVITANTSKVSPLYLFLEKEPPIVVPPIEYLVGDSSCIYTVKIVAGDDSGKYIAETADSIYHVDSVYAHLPYGQYIVNQSNPNGLQSRMLQATAPVETLVPVIDTITSLPIPNRYVFGIDTVEVKPITYGDIDRKKQDVSLGYKYLLPSDLQAMIYSFEATDAFAGRLLGIDEKNMLKILQAGDTSRFIIDYYGTEQYGTSSIKNIVGLERSLYSLRLFEDTTIYLGADGKATIDASERGYFYITEDTVPGQYCFKSNGNTKLLADIEGTIISVAAADPANTYFVVNSQIRPSNEESDPYTYLTNLEAKLYNISLAGDKKSLLSRNVSGNAVFAREGESMLRAGSYEPVDFCLWIGMAQNEAPNKPSFYIVKDAKNTNTSDYNGYFLHFSDDIANDGIPYNKVDFIEGTRKSGDEINTVSGTIPSDTCRFYLQELTPGSTEYYIVTEDEMINGKRGYLSIKRGINGARDTLYFGPRDVAVAVELSEGVPVANERVAAPAVVQEVVKTISVVGEIGQIVINNASGEQVLVFNIVGQQVANKRLASDKEIIPVPRGLSIVKIGNVKTQKVVVR